MTQERVKRIFVYTEDAPVHPDVMAHGMHRASPSILRAIIGHIDGIAMYQIRHRYERHELDRELEPLCIGVSRPTTVLCKALRRYPALDFGISDTLPAHALARVVRNSPADILFSHVGADPGILTRAAKLASLAGKQNAFYVVDDFLAPMRIAGATGTALEREHERARKALFSAKHIFTITDGLGDHLRRSYGISSTTLPLPFEPGARDTFAPKNQILYAGSINFLYAAGLLDLFRAVDRVRQAAGVDLTVRLLTTSSAAEITKLLGKLPPFVVFGPARNGDDLISEIASSIFAFLPYSFDAREKSMVTTSFPSKALEYLAYARSILVYGPDYGVATKLFRETGMPSIATSAEELEQAAVLHLTSSPDHSVIYRKYLIEEHSLAASRKTICGALGLEID
jgi:hypothetical protein